MRPFPVLWIYGPSGIGKTSTGYELFEQLAATGTPAAYVDLDQIGHCYPVPSDDLRNNRLRARALGHVYAGVRASGAQCLVVSGLVDDLAEVRRHAHELPGVSLTLCRLRADAEELRDRIVRRGLLLHLAEDAVRNAAELDRTDFADLVVDTTDLAVPAVVTQIRAAAWPGATGRFQPCPPAASSAVGATAVPVLWLCGPPAVGTSTVGFTVFLQIIDEGEHVAYIDLSQLGFSRPVPADDPDQHRLKADLLARLWPELQAAGARRLIIVGGVTDRLVVDRYRDAIPSGAWTVCRLTAGLQQLEERTVRRGRGEGPPIAGDELRGLPRSELLHRAESSARIAEVLECAGIGDLTVDTNGLTAAQVASLVRAGAAF